MKILVAGAGPGGLYAAILLKKAHPDYDITICERNPDGATYGWGVVFSDQTLNSFREADYPTYQRITGDFIHWSAIDTYYRGQFIRASGHDFAGMSRRRLLQILQDRCRELGVTLAFEQELLLLAPAPEAGDSSGDMQRILDKLALDRNFATQGQLTTLDAKDFDLVIAADGVNSRIRSTCAHAFGPSLTAGASKFVWFGTDRLMDAFTFIFRENEHGLFQVHAYPFDSETSTFIVETEEATWRRAGLDQASETESLAYCEALFADYLQGARLLTNRSLWGSFIHVHNRRWRYSNIVLLGDAAHTAHFSIGSGTKLAMDGAIALAQAFESTDSVEAALRLYELDRRPRVEALQQAARVSQTYFENARRYLHLEPQQFTFQLLTRSGRIHYDNLRTRDPYYIDALDRWFGNQQAGGHRLSPPPMFSACTLRGLRLHNRVAISAPDPALASGSGAALLISPPVAVLPEGRISAADPTLCDEADLDRWQQVAAAAHAQESKLALLLNHAGRRGAVQPPEFGLDRPLRSGGWELIAPSPLPYHASSATPREMAPADFERVQAAFLRSVQMADQAGVDLLLIHMAQGYLLASLLSPLSNQRSDEYGGSLAHRMRFPLALFEAVRAVWPAEKPLGVLLNVDDCARGGLSPADALQIGRALKDRGCDLLEPLAGYSTLEGTPPYGPGFLTGYADALRHDVQLPVLVGGYLRTSGEVNTLVAAGRADLCRMELPTPASSAS